MRHFGVGDSAIETLRQQDARGRCRRNCVGWRVGSHSTHVPCVDQNFDDLVADFGADKRCIARVEPTSPAKSLKTNKLKLAERVGFELSRL
jgi:hypothetical protein